MSFGGAQGGVGEVKEVCGAENLQQVLDDGVAGAEGGDAECDGEGVHPASAAHAPRGGDGGFTSVFEAFGDDVEDVRAGGEGENDAGCQIK